MWSVVGVLHQVHGSICGGQESIDFVSVSWVDSNSDAYGYSWFPAIFRDAFTNAAGHEVCGLFFCFRQDKCKLISAKTGSGVNFTATHAQSVSHPAKRLAADYMAVNIIDLF